MKPLLMFTLLTLCCAPAALAQTTNDDYRRFEVYGGYSHTRFDFDRDASPVATVPDGLPAFEFSATYNVTRYVGLKGVFTAGFSTQDLSDRYPIPCADDDPNCDAGFQCQPGDTRPQCVCLTALTCPDGPISFKRETSLYQLFGGVQFKDNSGEARLKPVAHVLAGAARLGQTFYPDPDDPNPPLCPACVRFDFSRTAFAMDIGGGLDVRLGSRLDLRVFQLTYNPTFFGGGTQHNLRLGAGLAIH